MQRTKPPFRADMVGSLLRTAALKDARHKHHDGEISDAALKEIEDREIRALIKRQEEIGLQAVTDGEFRRAFWHFDFLEHLDGVTSVEADSGMNFKGGVGIAKALRITGKVGFSGQHPMIDHFRFVKDNTDRVAKMTIQTYRLVGLAHSSVEITTEAISRSPPMVGVSRLAMCACGPSSRICWPIFQFFRPSINLFPKTSEISSAVTVAYAVRNVTY